MRNVCHSSNTWKAALARLAGMSRKDAVSFTSTCLRSTRTAQDGSELGWDVLKPRDIIEASLQYLRSSNESALSQMQTANGYKIFFILKVNYSKVMRYIKSTLSFNEKSSGPWN